MSLLMVDLRHVHTGVRLTPAERMEAVLRHFAAMNSAQLNRKRAYNARRGLIPMVIGTAHVPASVARAYTHCNVGGTK